MRFSATRQSLLALPTRTRREREKQPTPFRLRVQQGFLALFLALVPVEAWAQVGREFVTVEAHVGRARVVHVGKILEIKQIEYGKPLTDIQKLGKPHRLVFAVSAARPQPCRNQLAPGGRRSREKRRRRLFCFSTWRRATSHCPPRMSERIRST